jgi:hypothetical protein
VEVDAADLNRLLSALVSMRDGNFRKRLTVAGDGPMAEVAAVFNEVADRNLHLTGQLARVRRVAGREVVVVSRCQALPQVEQETRDCVRPFELNGIALLVTLATSGRYFPGVTKQLGPVQAQRTLPEYPSRPRDEE